MTNSYGNQFHKIFWPVIFSSSMFFIFNIIDSYFLAQLSTESLAALGLMTPFVILTGVFFGSLPNSLKIKVGQAFGANKIPRIRAKILISSIMSLFIALIVFLPLFIFSDDIFLMYSDNKAIEPLFYEYFSIWIFTIFFQSINKIYSSVLYSFGETKATTIIGIVGIFINLILDYFLIFGFLDFQGIGIAGAAVASLVAYVVQTVLYFSLLYKKDLIIFNFNFNYSKIIFLRLSKLSIPFFIAGLTMPFAMGLFTVLLSYYSSTQIAAVTMAMKFDFAWFIIAGGFGSVFSILMNQYIGSKSFNLIPGLFKSTIFSMFVSAIILVTLGIFFGREVGDLMFIDPATSTAFAHAIPFISFQFIFWGFIGTANGFLSSLGKAYLGSSMSMVRTMSTYVVFPLFFFFFFDYEAMLYSFIIGPLVSFLYSFYIFKNNQDIVKL